MSFNSSLNAGQINKQRGTGYSVRSWYAAQEISICPNTTVFAARVNGAITAGSNYAQITYDTVTTGAYTDIQVGQTVLISHTNDKRAAYLRLRARKTPTSTILYINEINNAITDNDYIFVIDHYDLTDKLARPDTSTDPIGQFKDYDKTYQLDPPVIVGLQTGYQGDSSASTHNGLRIVFDVSSSYSPVPGRTVAYYAWTFASGTATVVSGNLNSPTLTVDITAGWQWASLYIEDNAGLSSTRHFAIAVDFYTEGFEGAQITGDLQSGYNAHITGFAGLSTVLNGTFCIIGRPREYYNDVSGVNVGNSIDFVGWLNREDNQGQGDPLYSFASDVSFELIGVGAALARLEMQQILMRINAAPTVWDEFVTLTPWRAIVHVLRWHTTALELCDLTFDDVTDTFIYPFFDTQGGNPLVACNNAIGSTINSSLAFAADGRIEFARTPWHLSQSARDALPVIANFTNVDLLSIEEPIYHRPTIGRIDSYGGFYNGGSGQTTALRSLAPGYAQGEAEGQGSLNNQVLQVSTDQNARQTELNQRAGNELNLQNPNIEQTFVLPDGYYWLTPSQRQVYTWTLDGSENVRGLVYTTADHWICTHVEHQHNNEHGSRDVRATFRLIPIVADPGATVPAVMEDSVDNVIPDLPAFDAFPQLPELNLPGDGLAFDEVSPDQLSVNGVMPLNGDGDLIWTATQAWLTKNYITLTSPQWREITPTDLGSFQIKEVIFDPFYQYGHPVNVGAYLLASDGEISAVWETTNVAASPPTWTKGAEQCGIYTKVEPTNARDDILIYAPQQSVGSVSYNFLTSDGGWVAAFDGSVPITLGNWVSGLGWESVVYDRFSPRRAVCDISISSGLPVSITRVAVTARFINGKALDGSITNYIEIFPNPFDDLHTYTQFGIFTAVWTGSATSPLRVYCAVQSDPAGPDPTGLLYIMAVDVNGTYDGCPLPNSSASSTIMHSSNRGSTFAGPFNVGAQVGSVGGFDAQPAGIVSYGAAANKVRKASTLGGAYSDFLSFPSANAVAIFVPHRRLSDSGIQTTVSDPDLVVGLDGLDSGHCLYKVTGAGVKTGITPPSCTAIVGPFSIAVWWQSSLRMAVIGVKSGANHLFVTTNGGTSWTDLGAFSGLAGIQMRAGPQSRQQLFAAGGALAKYSNTFSTLQPRTAPVTSGLSSISVLG